MLATVRAAAVVLLALCAIGCGDPEIIYRDYPVDFQREEEKEGPKEEASLVLGTFDEQLFDPLDDGDELPIVFGFQGGTWVHTSLRARGVSALGRIEASLGDGIGSTAFDVKLIVTADGTLEAHDIPIPVDESDGSLDGTATRLEVTYSDDEESVSAARDVVLVEL